MSFPATYQRLHAPTGCQRCVCCRQLRQCWVTPAKLQQLWPGSLDSPTVFFMAVQRQLTLGIQNAALEGPAAWRQHSVAGDATNTLLQRRGLPQMSIKLPLTPGSGLQKGDSCIYIGERAGPPTKTNAFAAPAIRSGKAPAPALTAPQQQPAKRTCVGGAAAAQLLPAEAAVIEIGSPGHLLAASSGSSMVATPCDSAASAAHSPLVMLLQRVKALLSPAAGMVSVAA